MGLWNNEKANKRAEKVMTEAVAEKVIARTERFFKERAEDFIKELLFSTLTADEVSHTSSIYGLREQKTIIGEFKEKLFSSNKERTDSLVQEKAEEIIFGEEFLDKLVERIHKKQL